MSNTKQPPQDLVEKMRKAIDIVSPERINKESISYDHRPYLSSAFVDGAIWIQAQQDKVIHQCAQIALDYAEETRSKCIKLDNENIKLKAENRILKRKVEIVEEENRELREMIETLLNSGQLDEYYIEKAEQLLNKNEDGKE